MAMTTVQSVSGLTRSNTVDLSGTVTVENPTGHPNSLGGIVVLDNGDFVDWVSPQTTAVDDKGYVIAQQWSYTASGLADGTHNFSIYDYESYDGTQGDFASTITVDTTPPTLTAGESITGTTAGTGIVLSGTVSDANGVSAVEIMDTNGATWTDIGPATISGNTWQLTAGHLMPGAHNFVAIASDNAGNYSSASTGGTVNVVTDTALAPAILRIVGNRDGGVTLLGRSAAGSTVTISDTSAGVTQTLGSVTAGSDGSYSLTTHNKVSTAAVNTYSATARNAAGQSGASVGLFQLSSSGADTMSGTTGQSDVFATFLRTGQDTISGFETTRAVGAVHDVLNLSGTGYGSYAQVASHISGASSAVIQLDATRSVSLLGVSASSLQASDFRFS